MVSAQETVSPVGLENLMLRYRVYRYASLLEEDRRQLMTEIESFVRTHRFQQKMRVVRTEHKYETWDSVGAFEWQWQIDESPSTLLRTMGRWSFHGEKMAMNVDDGNCLAAVIRIPDFSIGGEYPFSTIMAEIVDFEVLGCADFAEGEGNRRHPSDPDAVEYRYWRAESLGVSIAATYGTIDLDSLAAIFAEIPLDQPVL